MRLLLAISGIFSVYILKLIAQKRKQNPRRLPYPPGPKGYPIIGNLLELPLHKPWLVYQELSRRYGTGIFLVFFARALTQGLLFQPSGDITYLEAVGQPILIVNTLSRALELLDKRAVNYSDRPLVPTMEM
jgi:hypothetical protein